jgi:O-acetyl-ADP-ribose deacetylase (regulator of RNase III)
MSKRRQEEDLRARACCDGVHATVVDGDLLEQKVEVIVNAWNRNVIPWWLLWPQGVSGAIKRRGGAAPFRELARHGPIPLGGAVVTSAGELPFKAIIHVAGISMAWRASEESVHRSTLSAVQVVKARGFASVGFPILGAGTGGLGEERALQIMLGVLADAESRAVATVVRFR